jgi:hypothetical protein
MTLSVISVLMQLNHRHNVQQPLYSCLILSKYSFFFTYHYFLFHLMMMNSNSYFFFTALCLFNLSKSISTSSAYLRQFLDFPEIL